MKRIFSLLLIVALIGLQLLSFPTVAYAASDFWSENGNFINVLDYASVNDSGNYSFSFTGSYDAYFYLPYEGYFQGFDILVEMDSSNVSAQVFYSGYDQTSPLTKVNVVNNVYQFYGQGLNLSKKNICIRFTASDAALHWVSFKSFYCNNVSVDRLRTAYSMDVFSYNMHKTASSSSGQRADISISSSAGVGNRYYDFYINCTEWYKFDFIEVIAYINAASITSVSAVIGSYAFDPIINYITNDNLAGPNSYIVSIIVDVSRISPTYYDVSGGAPLEIAFQGDVVSSTDGVNSGLNQFSCLSALGGFFTNYPDPYITWLQKLFNQTAEIFSSSGVGETVKQQSQQKADGLSSAVSDLSDIDKISSAQLDSDIDFSGILSGQDLAGNTSFLTHLFEVPSLLRLGTLALIFAMVATALFGKR